MTLGVVGVYFGLNEPILLHERTLAFGGIALVAGLIGLWRSYQDRSVAQNIAIGAIVLGVIALVLGFNQRSEFEDSFDQLNDSLQELQRQFGP